MLPLTRGGAGCIGGIGHAGDTAAQRLARTRIAATRRLAQALGWIPGAPGTRGGDPIPLRGSPPPLRLRRAYRA